MGPAPQLSRAGLEHRWDQEDRRGQRDPLRLWDREDPAVPGHLSKHRRLTSPRAKAMQIKIRMNFMALPALLANLPHALFSASIYRTEVFIIRR